MLTLADYRLAAECCKLAADRLREHANDAFISPSMKETLLSYAADVRELQTKLQREEKKAHVTP